MERRQRSSSIEIMVWCKSIGGGMTLLMRALATASMAKSQGAQLNPIHFGVQFRRLCIVKQIKGHVEIRSLRRDNGNNASFRSGRKPRQSPGTRKNGPRLYARNPFHAELHCCSKHHCLLVWNCRQISSYRVFASHGGKKVLERLMACSRAFVSGNSIVQGHPEHWPCSPY